jgi:hypothetical protein
VRTQKAAHGSDEVVKAELNLPIDRFVRTPKSGWPRLEMWQAVFDGSNRELALHMESRPETIGGKEVAIDPS